MASLACLLAIAACEPYNDPLEDEQYKKEVYLVGAERDIWEREISYNGDGSSYVSVAIGGSQFPEKDVIVTIGTADNAKMTQYNYKNFSDDDVKYQAMPTSWYSFGSTTGTIKAGNVYTRIPLTIDMAKLNPDSLYVIPLCIVSTSAYSIVTEDTTLLFHPKMVNDYSGAYTFDGVTYRMENGGIQTSTAAATSTIRHAVAVDARTIRLFQKVILEKLDNVADNTYTISVNSDNSLTIMPYENMGITAGGGTYNPDTRTFSLWYDYTENGSQYHTVATLMPSD